MKLWEMMLEGSKKGKQLFGSLGDGNGDSCAMGAVRIAMGRRDGRDSFYPHVIEKFPFTAQEELCPECKQEIGMDWGGVLRNVIHLNNEHRWRRQRIATSYLLPIEEAYLKK